MKNMLAALALLSGTVTAVSAPTTPDNRAARLVALERSAAEARARLEPVGTVIALAVNEVPSGWLPCDGQTLKTADYPALAAVLGRTGETYQLPDLRGTFLRGAGENRAPLTTQGAATAMPTQRWTMTVAESGAHNHAVEDGGGRLVTFRQVEDRPPGNGHKTPSGLDHTNGEINCSWPTTKGFSIDSVGDHTHTVTISGGDTECRPDNVAARFVIKAVAPAGESGGAQTLEERIRQVAFSLDESARHLCPMSTLVSYGGRTIPAGWVATDGQVVRRDVLPSLATLFAPSSVGDTFALPDLRGQFLRGTADGRLPLTRQGFATAMPTNGWTAVLAPAGAHDHGIDGGGGHLVISDGNKTVSGTDGKGNEFSHDWARCRGAGIGANGEHSHGASIGGGDPETRPANVAVAYLLNAGLPGAWTATTTSGPDPVSAAKLDRLASQLADLQNRLTPCGAIVAFAGSSVPVGWLVCDGRSINRRDCPELGAALGVAGETFALPDLRGTFLRCVGEGRAALSKQGHATALPVAGWQVSVAAAGQHSHAFHGNGGQLVTFNQVPGRSAPNGDYTPSGLDGWGHEIDCFWPDCPPITLSPTGNHTHAATLTGGDPETRPANTAVQFLIKK